MAFVLLLSFSRQIFLRFYLDQRMDNFLRGHVAASLTTVRILDAATIVAEHRLSASTCSPPASRAGSSGSPGACSGSC